MPDRLKKAMAAGDVTSLFGALKDWTPADLRELLADVDEWHESTSAEIEGRYAKDVFNPLFFFNKANGAALDAARDKAHFDLVAMCAEIASVAQFYLGRAANAG